MERDVRDEDHVVFVRPYSSYFLVCVLQSATLGSSKGQFAEYCSISRSLLLVINAIRYRIGSFSSIKKLLNILES
jgi:hypothetical protein